MWPGCHPEGHRCTPLLLSSRTAVALPDLLRPGQVGAEARELYVQTCREGKKDQSPQAQTPTIALHAANAAGGRLTIPLTFFVLIRPGEFLSLIHI